MTKAELQTLVDNQKSLTTRVEAAEAKAKALEDEKAQLIASRGGSGGGGALGSGADEQRALRFFGKSHPAELLNVNVASKKYKNVPDELKHLVLSFKEAVDTARFIAQRFHGAALDFTGENEKADKLGDVRNMLDTPFGKGVLAPAIKAFGSTVVGAGAEWVPTAVSSTFLEEFELKRVLEGRFELVNMPSNPFDMPKLKGVTKARKASEGQVNFAANNFQTDKIRLTAIKLEEFYVLPEELTEDSAPDFMAAGRSEVTKSQERAAESAMINGDSDGTHQDSDTQADSADVAEKVWDGFRKLGLGNSANGSTLDFGNVAVTKALLATLLSRMGKFGSDPEQLLILCGPVIYNQLRHLDDVFTVEKFGPMAVVLKGALMAWAGIPIINSEHYREDLNASGVYDGATTTRAAISIVNTKRFYIGQRRPIRVKLMPDLPGADRWLLASYRRVDFKGHVQGTVEKSVVYGYNIAK